jgi:siroheme synthase
VADGSLSQAREVHASLAALADAVEAAELGTPMLVYVGAAVSRALKPVPR